MEDQAAIGVAVVLILFIFLGVLAMRANVITSAFMRSVRAGLRTRTALISGIVLVMAIILVEIYACALANLTILGRVVWAVPGAGTRV